MIRAVIAVSVLILVAFGWSYSGQAEAPLERDFSGKVQPFVRTYCASCHGGEKPKAGMDFGAFKSADGVAKDLRRWEAALEQLENGTMPPAKAKEHPTAEARKEIVAWIREVRKHEAKRTAGDPGSVPPRRLSNSEYDYTIRDLIGVDIRPAKEFPVDPANEAGFDNSAESLAMSSALLGKYMEAARRVSEHLLLMPDGLRFAAYPVVADTDRDKYGVRQIINFYKRQKTDYADYFEAAWRYQYRVALRKADAKLDDVAKEIGVSAVYLAKVWEALTGPAEEVGPIAALQALWKNVPPPKTESVLKGGDDFAKMRDFVVTLRQKLVPEVKNLTARPIHNGSQTMVMWKNRQMAANRMRYAGGAAKLKLDTLAPSPVAKDSLVAPEDVELLKRYDDGFTRFCKIFPDAFYVSERARVYLNPESEKKLGGRLLSAGFHSMTGYFRDDGPLYELMLNPDERRELDRLWLEFDVITGAPMRTHTSFIWFERTDSNYMRGKEFEVFRAEDKDSTSVAKIKQLAAVYLAKARTYGASETALKAVSDHFEFTSASIRRVEETRKAAEPSHLQALQDFAERAYRRPLSQAERDGVTRFYWALRDQDGLDHENAVRDTLVSILLSPHFLFRVAQIAPSSRADSEQAKAVKVEPSSDYALASRLSYFLWSSMPDADLLARAKAGDLHRPEVLVAQARRMSRDGKIRGLATEFGGNWLDFRRFEEHNAVDRERFKTFTDELRRAMFEEPVRFVLDVASNDRSVLDFLYAKHTFVNPVLARHYGMPEPSMPARVAEIKTNAGHKKSAAPPAEPDPDEPRNPEDWARMDDAAQYGRGGLLPMAVFLTKNAPGLRTSPVKRGYWVVRQVLGEKVPAPPPQVPELPADEAKLGEITLREALARHRADKACAGCHERFDSFGLAFEGYGPVGERRAADLGGRPVDDSATFPGGRDGAGLDGLRAYLKERRQSDFVDNLCRKLLAYALGRTLIPGDDELIETMKRNLASNDYRFSAMVETIVTSSQFMNKRSQ